MSLRHATLRAAAWLATGAGVSALARVLIVAVLARLLAPADFGLIAAALIVIRFAELVSQMGVGPALVQRQVIEERHFQAGFRISILLSFLVAIVVWLAAPTLADFFGMPGLEPVIRALTALFPIHGLTVVSAARLERELRFDLVAKIETSSYVLGYGVVGVALAWTMGTHWALVVATILQSGLRSALLLAARRQPLLATRDRSAYRDLLRFTFGFSLTRVASFFALQGDNIVVGRWLGATALGFYNRAYTISSMPAFYLGRILNRVLFPALSAIQDEQKRVLDAFRKTLSLTALLLIPLSLFLSLLGPELVAVLLGAGWEESILPFRILVLGSFMRAAHKISGAVILASGAVYRHSTVQMIYALAVFVGAFLAQPWGLPAVAGAVLAAISLHFLLLTRLAGMVTGLKMGKLAVSLLPALVAGFAVLFVLALTASFARNSLQSPVTVLVVASLTMLLTCTVIGYVMRNSAAGVELRSLTRSFFDSEG